ncbi:hypothetical protein AMC81_PA00051 (plasmid) [Rhizobium phaseoli]|uniref:Uncharacterized protein n=2 Tax=Rhizobium phaseoli TaxID=396 RepID=A0ABM6CFQ7_9HYPH|nr:hypothetical protein AMC81_PA00051 [Rhizobium phaseoli]ANL93583.1 hypothetical protein AMC80_PA00051 [Rhizobium phaseoli]
MLKGHMSVDETLDEIAEVLMNSTSLYWGRAGVNALLVELGIEDDFLDGYPLDSIGRDGITVYAQRYLVGHYRADHDGPDFDELMMAAGIRRGLKPVVLHEADAIH